MSATRAAQLQDLARWTRTCSCDPCTRAREALTQSTERSVRIERIGAQAKKHVESKLRAHAGLLATWTMLRTTPQGLEVGKVVLFGFVWVLTFVSDRYTRKMSYIISCGGDTSRRTG